MAHTAEHIMATAAERIDEAGGITAFVRDYGIGGILAALFAQIIQGIGAAGGLLLGPPRALGQGLILLVDETIGGMVDVFSASTAASVRSFSDGIGALLGPFAQPFGAGVVMLTLFVFIWSVNRLNITPWSFITQVRS